VCGQWLTGFVVLGLMDFAALLYDPIYARLGVPAVLDLGTDGNIDLTVIDKTSGVEIGDGVIISTIAPAADVRMTELTANNLTRQDVNGAALTFNGKTWEVKSHVMRPGPGGEDQGEMRFILSDPNA
jgi:hypothetical protein